MGIPAPPKNPAEPSAISARSFKILRAADSWASRPYHPKTFPR